ncbi:MAG: protein-disulfide reductase DsbD domain-containing protein [Bryobacteraceae bacterium]
MRSGNFWIASALLWTAVLGAQTSAVGLNSLSAVVHVTAPEKVVARKNQLVTVDFVVEVKTGYHVNSNTPADEYLIPLKLTFSEGAATLQEVVYPKPSMEKFEFSQKPVSVFQGGFKTQAKIKILPQTPAGSTFLNGKLRYQACNDRMCLPPRTLDVKVPLEIRN